MFDIGFLELLIVALIGLIVLGPERLPKAAHSLGLIIGRIRRGFSQVQQELEREVRMQELKDKMKDPYATFMDEAEPPKKTSTAPPDEDTPKNQNPPNNTRPQSHE